MPNIELTAPVLIVAIICTTIITIVLLFRSKKVKVDKSGIDLELVKNKPEIEESQNETNTV
ncbi:MAG: hypothetical protein LBL62_10920 [Planctomycetaceae bacterium]|jgi:hypothetical protein|nr:hypothetical protein [Planctomycetaceae bacterium]